MHDTWPKRLMELCYDNSTEFGLRNFVVDQEIYSNTFGQYSQNALM